MSKKKDEKQELDSKVVKKKGKEILTPNTEQPDVKKKESPPRRTQAQRNALSQRRTKYAKKKMLGILEKSLGIVTTACRAAGLSRTQFYEWVRSDPDFKKDVDEMEEIALDFAESKLHGLIDGNDTAATIFFLKCRAKKRGYVERTEIDNTGEVNINIRRNVIEGGSKS